MQLLLENKHEISPSIVGIILFICCMFGVLSGFVTGRLIPRFGNRKLIYIASFIMILGLLLLIIVQNMQITIIIIPSILIYMGPSTNIVCLNHLVPTRLNV